MIPLPFKADWIAGALIMGAIVVAGVTAWAWRYQQGKAAGASEVQALWDADKLRRSTAALEAVKEFVAERNAQQEKLNEALYRLKSTQAAHARVVAELHAHASQLRDDINTYASGGREASADSVEACRARAEQLGQLLDRVLHDAKACAERGELDAATARSVLEAWPVSSSAP